MAPLLSVAVMENVNGEPVVLVGVPVSKPLLLSVKPAGRVLPDATVKVKPLPEPPLAVNCWL